MKKAKDNTLATEHHGNPEAHKRWVCPNCGIMLQKAADKDALGVKRCPACQASWFIVLCRRPTVEVEDIIEDPYKTDNSGE